MGGGTGRARHPIFPGLPGKLLLHTAPHCSQPWETHCSLTPRCADTAPRSETRYCILGQCLSLLPGLSPGCPLPLGYYGCPLVKGTSPSLLCVAPTKGATALGAPNYGCRAQPVQCRWRDHPPLWLPTLAELSPGTKISSILLLSIRKA